MFRRSEADWVHRGARRILLPGLILCAIATLALAVEVSRSGAHDAIARLDVEAATLSHLVATELQGLTETADVWAQDVDLSRVMSTAMSGPKPLTVEGLQGTRLMQLVETGRDLVVFDDQAARLIDTTSTDITVDAALVLTVLESGGPRSQDLPSPQPGTDMPKIVGIAPIRDAGDQPVGALAVVAALPDLTTVLRDLTGARELTVSVVDSATTQAATTPEGGELIPNRRQTPGGEVFVVSRGIAGTRLAVELMEPVESALVPARRARRTVVMATLLGSTAMLLLAGAWFGSGAARRFGMARVLTHMRATHAVSPVGIFEVTMDGVIAYANPAMCRMLGREQDEMLGLSGRALVHDDDTVGDRVMIEEALRDIQQGRREGDRTWERVLLHADGTPVVVLVNLAVLRDTSGIDRVAVVITDMRSHLEATEAIREANERATVLWEQAPIGVVEGTAGGRITKVNDAMADLLGRQPQDLVGTPATALADTIFHVGTDGDVGFVGEHRFLHADGRSIPVLVSTAVMHGPDGAVDRRAAFVVDVSELHDQRLALIEAEREARKGNAFFSAMLSASPDLIVVDDLVSGRATYSSRSLRQALGVDVDLGKSVHPDDQLVRAAMLESTAQLGDGQIVERRYRIIDVDEECRWILQRLTPFGRDDDGNVTEILSIVRDVTALVGAEERLTHAALHDSLTALPNRPLLHDRLDVALTRVARTREEVAILFCDLDGFKRVNDTGGHAAGDAVLKEVAVRLQNLVRESDTVARVGGDEFVVLLESFPGEALPTTSRYREMVMDAARRIGEALSRPIAVDGQDHVVTVSVGVTFAGPRPDGTIPPAEQVLRDADAAMYRAKLAGKDRVEVFDDGLRLDLAERGRVEQQLRASLSPATAACGPASNGSAATGAGTSRLVPSMGAAFQPVFRAADGTLASFEALARLTDVHGRLIDPGLFIGVAEETGLVRPLGAFMLDLACHQLRRWRDVETQMAGVAMAVNLSAHQVERPDLAGDVFAILQRHALAPEALVLELTETVLLQAGRSTLKTLQQLQESGVRILIDDFGTGYASLRYLASLPVCGVKVDRSFTEGIPHDPTSAKIVRAVIGLAEDLGLTCTVEGIENLAQLEFLPSWVMVQGHLFGKALSADNLDIHALLRPTDELQSTRI